ncbi:NUDIX domain-containing protein [Rhizobium sp. FY34]|uniref:NUDIX domain-containing protein n=1 Tax=Rhizobium sp. FY34 TaxID=2562309 RepID=UPI0010C0F85F|nr:NUDIX domain-containing protein [Rhizobium sp. FY34]
MGVPGIDFPGFGVGLVIRRQDGKILLYKRMKAPEAGHWNIVGGKVDLMEHSSEAAMREAEEETGLSIGSVRLLGITEQCIAADRQHWISVLYLAEQFTGEPSLTEPDKLSDMGWFSADDLPSPLSVFAQEAVRLLAVA